MRRWYGQELTARLAAPDLETAAGVAGVPLYRIPRFGDPESLALMRSLELDVAVSMGNGYIVSSFYQIPRHGMINIHHEWLPDYRGAQTVLWQIHDGSPYSGYTIHELSREIDSGRILHRERVPITFCGTLRGTVVDTSAQVQLRSMDGLARVLEHFDEHRASAIANDGERSYTTPGTFALMRILRNHRRLTREKAAHAGSATA
jgi:methionyl-tRNA formyltransferase